MKIGNRIKLLRKERHMTLDELARKSGVALATLSRMENDKMTGTLDSHKSICKSLGTSLTDLYKDIEDASKTVESVPKTKRTEYFSSTTKAKQELLVTKTQNKKVIPLMLKIEPSGQTQKEADDLGIEKFVYIMSGAIEATIGKEKYTLKQGDSIYFDASLEHIFKNTSKTDCKALCVMSTAD